MTLSPALKTLDSINFSAIVSVTLPTESVVCEYNQGQLITTVVYNQSLQGVKTSLSFTPPVSSNTFAMTSSTLSFIVNPENLDAYYIEPSSY
jgi:hypothetical protein